MVELYPDFTATRLRQPHIWAASDIAAIGMHHAIVGETICEAVDLHPNSTVLDIACGSGGAAIPAARRFCTTVALDCVPALLERGRERAAAERLDVEFVDGDAEALPFPDASFDVVLSTFGVMFASDQARAAAELLRVTRPGGTIGLANWTPEGFVGGIFRATANHLPPDLYSPTRWGTEVGLAGLIGSGVRDLRITRRHFTFRFPSPEAWLACFNRSFGPVKSTFEALEANAQIAFAADLLANVRSFNRATDGTMIAPAEYLEVVAIRT